MSELLDAKQQQRDMLKEIIKQLHAGQEPEHLKEKFADLLRSVTPTQISKMEEELIAEGIPETEIKRLCDVHVAVLKDSLDAQENPSELAGHPIHTFKMENEAIGKVVTSIREMIKQVKQEGLEGYAEPLRSQVDLLGAVEKHYLRKENQLFPMLEKHDVTGPTKVMWDFHDDVRRMLKTVRKALEDKDQETVMSEMEELLKTVEDMFYKEENILFPTALKVLTEKEWAQVRFGEEEIGYALVTPGTDWQPKEMPKQTDFGTAGAGNSISLSMGELTAEQINLVLTHLPVDVTYVDENDKVRYYSQGKERIFPRSPGIIGREVQNCHPSDSVHVVNKIVTAFKEGRKDSAEFWLEMNGRFIHIRYFVVRDKEGNYRGVVEVSQDVTEIKQLKGERRILSWNE